MNLCAMDSSTQARNTVIIGGGIVGISTAYFLTRHARYDPAIHKITVLEASEIAAGSSGKGGGFLASWATPKCLAPLSYELHKRLANEHGGEKKWGHRTVHAAEVKLRGRDHTNEDADKDDIPADFDWLDPESIKSYHPVGTPADSAQVHPFLLTNALAELAEQSGVNIILGHAKGINYASSDSSGIRVGSVSYTPQSQAENEMPLPASDIVVAAGPWTSKLLPRVKLLSPKGHSMVIQPNTNRTISPHILFAEIQSPDVGTLTPDIYPRPRDSLHSFETIYTSAPDSYNDDLPSRAADTVIQKEEIDKLYKTVSSVSSVVRDGKVIATQACYKAQIRKHEEGEEVGPIVGPVPGIRGLWVATGLDEWGVQNGPGVGLLMSEMILDGEARSADVRALDPKHWI
ncbi:FAD dependent oxidoreductase [Rhypophila decipiens]|uniref:FAD dependent oxidoreductase n=1 Tax=Rhypophila decipiens TaxID=261697 RepID=A0AAN6Y018_9PEZI|nr:FAD dependent oxidoreductase [Rhypophila decipiens]